MEKVLERLPALVDETGSFTSSTLASRLTKTFDLMGGALALDAGDCSSLAAISAAVDMLREGNCDAVLCAAGERCMDLMAYEGRSLGRFLSPRPVSVLDGHTRGGDVPAAWEARAGYAELVDRWLWSYGPGTVEDMTWWLGSTKAAVRTALDDLGEAVDPIGLTPGMLPVADIDGETAAKSAAEVAGLPGAGAGSWPQRQTAGRRAHKPAAAGYTEHRPGGRRG